MIIDKQKKEVNIFELTVPGKTGLKISHNLKYQKYQHLNSDIRGHTVNVTPFKIGSQTGYISLENKGSARIIASLKSSNIIFLQ